MKFLSNLLIKAGLIVEGATNLSAAAAVVDTDKFVVLDGNTIKYRTGAEVAADIGAVSSVGLSMPSAFNVANSPVTSSGTLAVTGAGTASQYIRGDGVLATLPTGGSGGSSVSYYLNGGTAASVGTYYQMSTTAVVGANADFTRTGNGLISQFLTDAGDPNRLQIPAGNWNFEMFFSMSSSGGTPQFYVELLKYDGTTFTSIASSSAIPETISGGTIIDLYLTSLAIPATILLATDRLALRVYIVNNSGGRTATLHTQDSHLCQIITNFAGGVSALNGLTANTQYFAVGTSGSNFNISSATDTHTFNLPSASGTNRGLLTSADWTTFNNKPSGTGVSGQVAYWSGTNTQVGSADLVYNNTNKSFQLSNSTNSGTTRGLYLTQTTADGAGNLFIFQKSRGGIITSGTTIAVIDAEGFDGTSYQKSARISFTASGTISSGIVPGTIAFVTANASGVLTGRTTINESGLLTNVGNFQNNGNALLGGSTDSGQRLQVTGDTLMKGTGATSATTALTVQNSDATNLFRILNDNTINIGLRPAVSIYPTAFGAVQNITGRGIAMSFIASDTAYEPLTLTHGNFTTTANGYLVFNTIGTFNPTSGTATYTANRIGVTINQTGGANGITRGLYIAPTLTAAADWRSIEWSNNTGWGLYGAGTAPNLLNGRLFIPTGSYDAPSLSFANDTNTGLFSPLADNIELKTGTNNAVVLENQGINLKINSESLTTGVNVQNIGVGIPGGVVAPDGTTTANVATSDTSLNQHRFFYTVTTTLPFTMSVYAKTNGYNFISLAWSGGINGEGIIFDIVNGTISGTASGHTAKIENVGNGWFRCSLIYTTSGGSGAFTRFIIVRNANSTANYSGDGTSGVYLWGFQIEENTTSTSYIRTEATAVTRPQAVSILGANLYGNLITRKVGAPSLTDFALTTDYTDRVIVKATTGNVLINSNTDSGQRLQVSGDTLLKGSGNTSATVALTVQNSDGSAMFRVSNDALVRIGSSGTSVTYGAMSRNDTTNFSNSGDGLLFSTRGTTEGTDICFRGVIQTSTTGNAINIALSKGFSPTSGTSAFTQLLLNNTINQTGGANGITRGLYINPTLTAAADWRSIEWSNNTGWGLYGVGTANNFLSGNTQIGTGAFTSEKLQVNGTMKVTGASTFGGNMTVSLNQNAGTKIEVSNTTSGTAAASILIARTTNGTAELSKNSATTTPYKIAGANDGNLYNFFGNLNILNDTPTGSIVMAAGGSSTAQMTLTSAGNLCIGVTSGGDFLNIGASTTAKAQINLTNGVAPTSPTNGDIWFDGTDMYMRIGGVTKPYLITLTGEATNSGSTVTLTNSAVIGKVLTGLNVTSGAVTSSDSILTALGKVQGQINSLQGGTIYRGSWNASTNTPTITSSVGTSGHYYVVTTAGTTTINGISSWAVGDWIIFNGTVWEKIPNVDAVVSVNGQVGSVVLSTLNITENTNLYYTDTRARAAISLTTSGSSGASTYSSGVLNIPNYTLAGLGGVPTSRSLTINGTALDLSADRSFSVGTVTSVSALTIGTSGTDISSNVTNGSTTPVINLNIPTSSASNRGALSSADWTTFNSKQTALNGTGFVKISGTTISYDNSTYYLASNPSNYITLSSLSEGTGISYNNTTGVITSTITQYTDALARLAISESVTGLDYDNTTGVFTLTSGYVIPTTTSATTWDAAYNDKINSASVTGTTTKTLTLNQQDGGTITASWTDINTDAVTSVFGRTGAVVATSGDYTTAQVTEVTNLYYTEARVNANTNVAANTAARHNAVTLGTANGLSLSTQVLSLGLASSGATGALSSTDWNTFNGKQTALNGTGFVKISGTTISYDNSTYYLASNPNGYTTNTGTVTSVSGTGTVSGLTLTGTVTASGSLTLGGTLTLTSGNVTTALGYTPYSSTNPAGYTSNTGTVTSITAGSYLTGGTITSSGTIAVDATTTNTASKIVARDASGNFSAGTITATLSGTASNATTLGTLSLQSAGSAPGASQVLRTDTNGYSYFGYINSNTSNAENPAISQIIVTNVSDGFYRKASLSHLTSAVQGAASGSWGISVTGSASTTPLVSIDSAVVYGRSGLQFAQSAGPAGNSPSIHQTPTGDWWHVLRMNHANNAGYYADLAVSMTTNLGLSRRVISAGSQLSNWVTILDALNYNSYSPTLTGTGASGTWGISISGSAAVASISSQVTINYNNNSDASYQMLWGAGNSVYGTAGITCNPFTDTVNLTGTLNSAGIGVVGFGRMYSGDFWHSGVANNGTRTPTFKLGRFSDVELAAYTIYTDDTSGDILELLSERYTADLRLTRNSDTGVKNVFRVSGDGGGSTIDLYTGNGSTLGASITSYGDARFAYDVVAYYSFSDARLKKNVATIENPLQKVMAMRGVSYEWNEGYKIGKKEIGLIAQEVMEIIPEVVAEKERIDGSKFLSVDYEHLTGLLIEAVKELKKEVDELKSK